MNTIKTLVGKVLIYLLKKLDVNLLPHAKVQNGLGCVDPETNGEKSILRYLSSTHKLDLIMDVGANDGKYSLMLKSFFPNAIIHAFEPMETTFALAKDALLNTSNIYLQKKALGASNGEIILYNDASNHWDKVSTSYPSGLQTFFGMNDLQAFPVELIRLDNYVDDKQLKEQINFIKIDVEGAELEVLKGAKNLIENNMLEIIQFEFNNFNIASKTYLKDFYDILPCYRFYRLSNYKLYNLGKYNADNENFIYQNILAVHPSKFNLFPKGDIKI